MDNHITDARLFRAFHCAKREKAVINGAAKTAGWSTNEYINQAVNERMNKE